MNYLAYYVRVSTLSEALKKSPVVTFQLDSRTSQILKEGRM